MPPAVLRSAEAVSALQCISLLSAGDADFLVETLEICFHSTHVSQHCAPHANPTTLGMQQTGGETFKNHQHSELLSINLNLIFVTVQCLMKASSAAGAVGAEEQDFVVQAPARADLLVVSVVADTEIGLAQILSCF